MIVLTPREVEALTLRQRPGWQARILAKLGIPYRRRPDGTLLVLRVHVVGMQDERPAAPQLRLDA